VKQSLLIEVSGIEHAAFETVVSWVKRAGRHRRSDVGQDVSCAGRFTRAGTQTVSAETNMSELAGVRRLTCDLRSAAALSGGVRCARYRGVSQELIRDRGEAHNCGTKTCPMRCEQQRFRVPNDDHWQLIEIRECREIP
jgi:hypothetical protein